MNSKERLKAVRNILSEAAPFLCENMSSIDIWLTELQGMEALTYVQVETIRSKHTDFEKVDEMLDFLIMSPVTCYDIFLQGLHEDRPDLFGKIKAIERKHENSGKFTTRGSR